MARKLIFDVGVQLDSPAVKACKTEDDVKKLDLFSHLSKKDQDEAAKQVLKALKEEYPDEEEQQED